MPDHRAQSSHKYTYTTSSPISWWSWRPGVKPRNAFLLGTLFTVIALLLIGLGLLTLLAGILDSYSAPLRLPGTVTKHAINSIDGQPRLSIRLHTAGFPTTIAPIVTSNTFHLISDNEMVNVDYSPRLHFLYALESTGHTYPLPDASAADNPLGSLAVLLLGLVLLPYPALLTLWGWQDLQPLREGRKQYCTLTARVVGIRAINTIQTRLAARPGLFPRTPRPWYGVALQPINGADSQQILTFSITSEMHRYLDEEEWISITYSPHLHYVYALEKGG